MIALKLYNSLMRWYDYIFILHLEKLRLREIKNFINPVLHFPLKPAHLPTAMLKQHEQNIIFPFSSSVFIYIMPIFFFFLFCYLKHIELKDLYLRQ